MDTTTNLSKVIDQTIEEQDLDSLMLYLSSTPTTYESFNNKTLTTLVRVLKKRGKHEDKTMHVRCVLSCLQHFLDIKIDPQRWIELSENIISSCELVFNITSNYIKDEQLLQSNIDTMSAIVEHCSGLADNMLRYLMESLLRTATCATCSNQTRLSLLNFIGILLTNTTRGSRAEVLPSIVVYLEKLSNYLMVSGDYESQVSIVEVLARCWIFIKETKPEPALFSDQPEIMQMFTKHKFFNFDPECRLFLNEVNEALGAKQLVYSIPCMIICSESMRFKKPVDDDYKEFWVDFNVGTRSISFYYMPSESEGWEVMHVSEENIICAKAKSSSCKARNGIIAPAVKIELTVNYDSIKHKCLKIYAHKTRHIEKFEKTVMKDILGDKYKSEVTYDDLPSQSKDSPPKNRSQPPPSLKLDESNLEGNTFIETSTTSLRQLLERNSDQSDMDGNVEKTMKMLHSEDRRSSKASDENSSDSDSFCKFIKEKKEQNEKMSANIKIVKENILEAKIIDITKSSVSKNSNVLNSINKTNTKMDISQPISDRNASGSPICDKELLIRTELAKSPSSTEKKKTKRTQVEIHDPLTSSKKRRLYSCKNSNTNDLVLSSQEALSVEVPAYTLKKQEPRIVNKNTVNRKNITYSYINKKDNEQIKRAHKTDTIYSDLNEPDKQLLDLEKSTGDTNSNDAQLKKSSIDKFNYLTHNERKLKALNKSPEGTLASNIFSSKHNIYSDFSSSGNDIRFKKTYARPKQKKRSKRAIVKKLDSSESDSDYIPPTNVSPPNIHSKKLEEKINLRTSKRPQHVSRLANNKVDPIRDIECPVEMVVEPENPDEPKKYFKAREIEVQSPQELAVAVPLKGPKNKKAAEKKIDAPKKVTGKSRKKGPIQTRTTRGQQNLKVGEQFSKDMETKGPESMDIVNYEPPEAENIMDIDCLGSEIFSDLLSQDDNVPQASFNTGDMVKFGQCCLVDVNNKVKNILNLNQKEREMNYAAFNFKAQACTASLNTECQKLDLMSKNLLKAKSMLDTTFKLQTEIIAKIQAESVQLEETKEEFMKNIAKIESTESTSIASVFKGCGRFLREQLFSITQGIASKFIKN